jgi:hypothetical protein
MIAYCGRPAAASFRDPSANIARTMPRYTIAEICSLGVALVTAGWAPPSLVRQAPTACAVAGSSL